MLKSTIIGMSLIALSASAADIRPSQMAHTFSIVCYDSTTGQFGAAVQSHWFKVADVIWAEPGVGAVATQSLVDIDDVHYLVSAEDSPESDLIKREEIERLRDSIVKLSFDDREIITLYHFRNMSYDEIAELLDIPRGTVMSRLYYARKRLGTLMGGQHG